MTGLSLIVFYQEIDKLKQHLLLLEKFTNVNFSIQNSEIDEEIKQQANEILYKNTDEKIFDYNSNVISLYGFWEKFVESIIKEYLDALRSLNTGTDNRNSRISPKYRESILPLFGKVERQNYKVRHLSINDLINALYKGCSQAKNDYIPEAFLQSGGNYNYTETSDCLKRLGFTHIDQELCRYGPIKSYFINQGMSETTIYSIEPSLLYSKLNELVSLRNEIAHGGSDGSNIIDASGMMVFVEFLQKLASAIFEYMNDDILSEKWAKKKSAEIEVRHYFARYNVSELRRGVFYIDINAPVLCFRGNQSYPHFVWTRVLSINVDDIPYTEHQYLSHDSTQKVTLVMDYTMRRGDFLKFEE